MRHEHPPDSLPLSRRLDRQRTEHLHRDESFGGVYPSPRETHVTDDPAIHLGHEAPAVRPRGKSTLQADHFGLVRESRRQQPLDISFIRWQLRPDGRRIL